MPTVTAVRGICERALLVLLLGMPIAAAATDTVDRIAATAVELDDDTGFDALQKAIGDARIVMLGEPWHGDGAAIAERARLVEYLHEQLGFEVLVFEADFLALHLAWEQAQRLGRMADLAPGNVYAFWSSSAASRRLWQYIDQQLHDETPLIVAGIDTKLVGVLSRERLPVELNTRLRALDGTATDEAQTAVDTLTALLAPGSDRPGVTDAGMATLKALVDRWAESSPGDTDFWAQVARGLKHNLAGEDRDSGMAENLIWLATRMYPDKKLIVWAHNNHILLDKWALLDGEGSAVAQIREGWTKETVGRKTYLGEAARHYFGRDTVYAIATVSYGGRYSSNISPALYGHVADFGVVSTLSAAPVGTLEAALHSKGHAYAFVDLRPFRGETGTVPSRAIDYTQIPPLPLRLWDGYDAVLYLDRTYGLEEEP